MAEITVTVDGVKYADHVEPRMLLVHYLREVVGKTGTPIGCDTSNCGACTVLLDGQSVKSCSVLAVQADGAEITTIQGLANGGLHPLQRAFHEEHALQCGYCTPGMIVAASDLLRENPHPSDDEIRDGLEGNLCRCTGYENIVRAVRRAAQAGVSEGPRRLRYPRRKPPSSARRACARKTSASSPARPTGPTTSRCPGCCTSRSSAARTRTPGSPRWTSARPGTSRG